MDSDAFAEAHRLHTRMERAKRRCRVCGEHRDLHHGADDRLIGHFNPNDSRYFVGGQIVCHGFVPYEGPHHLHEVEAKMQRGVPHHLQNCKPHRIPDEPPQHHRRVEVDDHAVSSEKE